MGAAGSTALNKLDQATGDHGAQLLGSGTVPVVLALLSVAAKRHGRYEEAAALEALATLSTAGVAAFTLAVVVVNSDEADAPADEQGTDPGDGTNGASKTDKNVLVAGRKVPLAGVIAASIAALLLLAVVGRVVLSRRARGGAAVVPGGPI